MDRYTEYNYNTSKATAVETNAHKGSAESSMTLKEKIRTHKSKCPYCGDNRYYVTRSDVTSVDAYGNEVCIKNGSDPFAVCFKCGSRIIVPWVEKKNRETKEKERKEYLEKLQRKGYKTAGIGDVMEKYGIEDRAFLDDILVFSGKALEYDDDSEVGCRYLLQDMYDCPWVFVECMDNAWCDFKEWGDKESIALYDIIYNKAVELSRQPCENLKPIYGVLPTAFVGTATEDRKILINGVTIEYTPDPPNCPGIFAALWRAVDRYNEIISDNSNI